MTLREALKANKQVRVKAPPLFCKWVEIGELQNYYPENVIQLYGVHADLKWIAEHEPKMRLVLDCMLKGPVEAISESLSNHQIESLKGKKWVLTIEQGKE